MAKANSAYDQAKRLDALMDQVIHKNQDGEPGTLVDRVINDFAAELIAVNDFALIWALIPEGTRKFLIRDRYYARRGQNLRQSTITITNSQTVRGSVGGTNSPNSPTANSPGKVLFEPTAHGGDREMEILARNMNARYENEKVLLNRIMVTELGKPLGECTFGDIRFAYTGSSARTRFYEMILQGREAFADSQPILGNVAPDEIEGFEKMASHMG